MVLLHEASPYSSREAVIEDDGRTVYLYLADTRTEGPRAPIRSLWIANLVPAPEGHDLRAMQAGEPPLMPRFGTRHPAGRRPFHAEDLDLVWLEEGDGVALLERGSLFGLIPARAGVDDFEGYAREAIGHQFLAWGLKPGLISRVESARSYWEWRPHEESWTAIRQSGLKHLESRLGPHRRYWATDGGGYPPRAAVLFEPPQFPGVAVCVTLGMSAQPMPEVGTLVPDPAPVRRVELAVATTEDPVPLARLLSTLTILPWSSITWFGDGHTYQEELPSGEPGRTPVMLLKFPPPEWGGSIHQRPQPAPELSGMIDRSGDPVTYLWLVPITAAEQRRAEERGSQTLLQELTRKKRGWVWRAET